MTREEVLDELDETSCDDAARYHLVMLSPDNLGDYIGETADELDYDTALSLIEDLIKELDEPLERLVSRLLKKRLKSGDYGDFPDDI